MKRVIARCSLTLVSLMLLSASPSLAQTNEEIFEQFQWNFSTPGARANGMGRAFIGVADDASAAVSNPAGLTLLTRPQLYVEAKRSKLEVRRFAAPDSLFTRATTSFTSERSTFPFLDFAIPLGSHAAVAFTRHETLNYEETFHLAPRPIPNHPTNNVLFPVDASVDFLGVSYSASVAATVHRAVRVGATISFDQVDARTVSTRRRFGGGPNRFALPETSITVNESSMDATDRKAGVIVGALFRPNDVASIGVVYAYGPKFTLQEDFRFNPSTTANQPLQNVTGFPADVVFNVPDRFGGGIAVRPHPRVVVAFDTLYVRYSELTRDLAIVISTATPGLDASDYAAKNAIEYHAGAEVSVRAGRYPAFIRGGAFVVPDHKMRWVGTVNPELDLVSNALFNLGSDDPEKGWTGGVGVGVAGRLQIDAALVKSDSLTEFVISAAARF